MTEDFMDAYEDNDEISEFVREIVGENVEVYTDYHYYSDGKHKLTIGEKTLQVNAWTTKDSLKEDVLQIKKEMEEPCIIYAESGDSFQKYVYANGENVKCGEPIGIEHKGELILLENIRFN